MSGQTKRAAATRTRLHMFLQYPAHTSHLLRYHREPQAPLSVCASGAGLVRSAGEGAVVGLHALAHGAVVAALGPRTRDYLARRTTDGKTRRETIRCLKRYIAREIYLITSPPQAEPSGA